MREEMYRHLIESMVKELEPIIRDFARGQFKKGILVHKAGVEEAMKEFPQTIVPLLRRDLKKMISKKRFDRHIFRMAYANPYRNGVTGNDPRPTDAQIKKDEAAMARALSGLSARDRAYGAGRRTVIERQFRAAIDRVIEEMMTRVLTGNLLLRSLADIVEGVDYADKVKEKMDARAMALRGRGQDLAGLTAEGVPDVSAAMVALMFGGSKGHGANLQPVLTSMRPAYFPLRFPERALRWSLPGFPRPGAKWGFEEQEKVKPKFKNSPRFEAIPFLTRIPRLDGDLSDWGKVRPLVLRPRKGHKPILVYAGWNYQGFFFGYQVRQAGERFYFPSPSRHKKYAVTWVYAGAHLQLLFDTLDARSKSRGEAHTQEFVILPRGSNSDPDLPGQERIIKSKRDATTKEYRRVKDIPKRFPPQPAPEEGPDGSGPYRVTRFTDKGYTVELFLPRSLFSKPIFCPGWIIGFDCKVAGAHQRGRYSIRQSWAGGDSNRPDRWGDLLLLGTDARIYVQLMDEQGSLAQGIFPGHSYLLTVVDPDRNVNPRLEDTVLISAEVMGGKNDVEVLILKETEKNSGIFRGFIDTQPGRGREVQGVLELMAGNEVRLGYVDFADARGRRKAVVEIKLPVVRGLMQGNKHRRRP